MAGERVLVIDDNAVNRRLVQVLLHSRGYAVCEAASAPEAFAMLVEKPPDIILMDLRLSGMTAYGPEAEGRCGDRHIPSSR
jgi:CheY-like chemotaxis protein